MPQTETTGQGFLPVRFFEALEQEVLLSQDMLAILQAEQKALVAMDMQALIHLSGKKENRLSRIQALDSQIVELTREFHPEAPDKTARFSALIPLLNQEEGRNLAQYRKKLTGLREEILNRNQINRHFAADVKIYLNDAISLITSGIAERPIYGGSGFNRKSSLNQPSLISREV